ncbi:MAG: hypothetical protein HOI53_02830 [Francisellaceae bacterium]|jgi:hypothetical protein|nr:hypothetical protein [Francisellaceae bacterium]MBT6206939.1 hypothetical protein [Francisellaceae bacterium]MBT6538484.1 hypothetical protein [Francisellaceae bacterium]
MNLTLSEKQDVTLTLRMGRKTQLALKTIINSVFAFSLIPWFAVVIIIGMGGGMPEYNLAAQSAQYSIFTYPLFCIIGIYGSISYSCRGNALKALQFALAPATSWIWLGISLLIWRCNPGIL